MRNFTIVAVSIMTILTTESMAQAPGKVTGSVIGPDNRGLSTATISLLKSKDSSLVKAAVSDAGGKFDIPVFNDGSYLLSYSLVGFEKSFSPVFSAGAGQTVI